MLWHRLVVTGVIIILSIPERERTWTCLRPWSCPKVICQDQDPDQDFEGQDHVYVVSRGLETEMTRS